MGFNSGEKEINPEHKEMESPQEEEIAVVQAEPTLLRMCVEIIRYDQCCLECLGRQFSYLATGTSNTQRAESLLLSLIMECHSLIKLASVDSNYSVFGYKPMEILNRIKSSTHYKPAILLIKQLQSQNPQNERIDEKSDDINSNTCQFCGNILTPEYIDLICRKIVNQTQDYEFSTFLVGTFLNPQLTNKEEEFRAKFDIQRGESFKANLNRLVGKKMKEIWKKEPDLLHPDLRVMINLKEEGPLKFDIQSVPIYIKGRYLKFTRALPQTHWKCTNCNGKGILRRTGEQCEICKGSGDIFSVSIHEKIQDVFFSYLGGNHSTFHGAGSENVSTQCLGKGRPFILEIKNPKKRHFNLAKIREHVNQESGMLINITDLSFVGKKEVHQIKSQALVNDLYYHALISLKTPISEEKFSEKYSSIKKNLTEQKLVQRTPLRLISKFKDQTFEHKIHSVELKLIDPVHMLCKIKCDRKTYIPEFISGDNFRSSPSLSGLFNIPLELVELTVIYD